MNTKNTGGPAFPMPEGDNTAPSWGMSLRDYVAAQIASGDAAAGEGWTITSAITDAAIETRAKFYYRMADAMLRARSA